VREPLAFVTDLHHAGRTRSRLDLTVDPSLPAVRGVERHLEHVLLNLVLNATEALQAQDDGAIRIGAAAEGDRVVVTVADNGPGLPPGLPGNLFRSPLPSAKGTHPSGLGLLVAHELLRASGGSLDYEPGPEPGARFVIRLPLWRREAGPPATP
jgi:two-component system, NtrC family, C4-dicarboxylate transport sensor histidine kinase DctB